MRFFLWALLAVTLALLQSACQTGPVPVEDYTLARTAMEAARAVEAARYSAGYWHQADQAYRKAQSLYAEHEYDHARKEFIRARLAAEKAENSARLIRYKSGEVL